MTMFNLFIACCIILLNTVLSRKLGCVCPDRSACVRGPWVKGNREVFAVTNGLSPLSSWNWDHLTLVMAGNTSDTSIMCETKAKGKKYGFIAELPTWNITDPEFDGWLKEVKEKYVYMHADAIGLDLLNLIGQCGKDISHVDAVAAAVRKINTTIKEFNKPKFVCIVPWKPPCFDGHCHLTHLLLDVCDYFVTSPDSYLTTHEKSCKARATVPKAMMILGLDEYLSLGVKRTQLMMGIPWHGYDYKCFNAPSVDHPEQCFLTNDTKLTGSCSCNYEEVRERVQLGTLMSKYKHQYNNHAWDGMSASPYFNYNEKDVSRQVWFESFDSLLDKYTMARELKLEGVMIWTADDLSNDKDSKDTDGVWYWMVHGLFLTGQPIKKPVNFAGKAAAIGVGCFLGGTLLGFVVTCIISQRRIQEMKKRKRPFELDMNADEFHDDVNNTL